MTHSPPPPGAPRRGRPAEPSYRGPADPPHRGPAARQHQPRARRQADPALRGRQGGPAGAPGARLTAALARSRAWARPASTGARLAAYTIDALACALAAAAAGVLAGSAVIGVVVLLEAAAILLILEARTGVTLGNLLLRLRTARDDAPFSPGIGRGLVRGLVQGAGSAFALIGGWIVVATSAADPSRMGRSWADRAGRTLVVRVPTVAERETWDRNAEAWAQGAPSSAATLVPAASAAGPVPDAREPRFVRRAAPQTQRPLPGENTNPQAAMAAPHGAKSVGAGGPGAVLPPGVVAVDAPIAPAPRPREVGEFLLLSFDTGQRERLRIPATALLGRQPVPSGEGEQLVAVYDPDGSVSKTHLRLEYRGGSVWVADLGSTNGSVLVDDTGESTKLERGARIRLDDGASVRMGERGFTVAVVTGEL